MIWQHPLCDKESDPRVSAEALQLFLMGIATLNPSYSLSATAVWMASAEGRRTAIWKEYGQGARVLL